jgi:hypothetical protein
VQELLDKVTPVVKELLVVVKGMAAQVVAVERAQWVAAVMRITAVLVALACHQVLLVLLLITLVVAAVTLILAVMAA